VVGVQCVICKDGNGSDGARPRSLRRSGIDCRAAYDAECVGSPLFANCCLPGLQAVSSASAQDITRRRQHKHPSASVWRCGGMPAMRNL